MNYLSDRINSLSESQTIAMSRKSRELAAQGHDIINLSLGEPDFNVPEHVKEATQKAIDDNISYYSPVAGFPDLKKAISDKFKRENNLTYAPEEIIVSTGAKQSLANVILCLVNPGDEVIVPAPYWVSYLELIKLAEGVPVIIEAGIDSNFKITAEQLEKAITTKTKMMVFSTPCNPTGSVYSKEELASLAKVLAPHKGIFTIADEIYEHINFVGSHESLAQFPEVRENVITVNGVSKGYAMTGWRLGYLGAPKWIVDACDKLQGQVTSGSTSIVQKAAVAALNSEKEITATMQRAFERRMKLVKSKLDEIKGVKTNAPGGAFYFFPDVSYFFGKSDGVNTINNSDDLCLYLINVAHVALVPGEAFGAPGYLRLSYATSDEKLVEAMRRMKVALEKLV